MGQNWDQGLLGCFGNCGVCIITFLIPCHTVGKIAEGLDDSYCYNCLCALVPIVDLFIIYNQRTRLRTKQDIDGSMLGDLFYILCCGPCALCQMSNEVEHMQGHMAQSMARE